MNIAFAYNVKHNEPSLHLKNEADGDFDSPETIEAIISTIQSLGHTVIRIEADQTAYIKLKENKDAIDLVFNIAEGLYGDARESQIPLFCEVLKIPYTHSKPTVHAITIDKDYTKLVVKGAGILVPESVFIDSVNAILPGQLNFPVIVKPNAEGSSVGIFDKNIVSNFEAFKQVVKNFADQGYKGTLLAEQYIEGREFTVSVLGNFPPKVLPIVEQRFDFLPKGFHHIAGYELKWIYEDSLKNPHDAYECPAELTADLEKLIVDTSLKAYNVLRVFDAARIDYRLSADGKLYFIEINTLPGINPNEAVISYMPLAARTAGLTFKDLVESIILNAARRYKL